MFKMFKANWSYFLGKNQSCLYKISVSCFLFLALFNLFYALHNAKIDILITYNSLFAAIGLSNELYKKIGTKEHITNMMCFILIMLASIAYMCQILFVKKSLESSIHMLLIIQGIFEFTTILLYTSDISQNNVVSIIKSNKIQISLTQKKADNYDKIKHLEFIRDEDNRYNIKRSELKKYSLTILTLIGILKFDQLLYDDTIIKYRFILIILSTLLPMLVDMCYALKQQKLRKLYNKVNKSQYSDYEIDTEKIKIQKCKFINLESIGFYLMILTILVWLESYNLAKISADIMKNIR